MVRHCRKKEVSFSKMEHCDRSQEGRIWELEILELTIKTCNIYAMEVK